MTAQTVSVIVQTIAVIVAAGGVVVALCIGITDRRAADTRARKDRLAADARADADRREARLLAEHRFRLDKLVQLAKNVSDPGHTDAKIKRQLSAERVALLEVLGPEGLTLTWDTYIGATVDESRTIVANEDADKHKRCQNEVVVRIADEITAWESGSAVRRA